MTGKEQNLLEVWGSAVCASVPGCLSRLCIAAAIWAGLPVLSASALEVVYDDRTPEENRQWAENSYVREQMEVLAEKICKSLYGDSERSRLHEKTSIILYLVSEKGGAPAFAAGRRITWKVGNSPSGSADGGMGLLTHEMTHVFDMRSDGVFTEAMADWVRNYKVWYYRCTDPARINNLRYGALRGSRNYGKYLTGAHFVDFMTQTYGEGTIYKILRGYQEHGDSHWEKTFGKDFDGLLAQWRQMETIHDPVFLWSYDGTPDGIVRRDKKFCDLERPAICEAPDRSGAWLDGTTVSRVNGISGGNMAIALHGRFPNGGTSVAIASLGAAREGDGKAVVIATGFKRDELYAYVVASPPGGSCRIVSKTAIPVAGLAASSHSIVLSTIGGNEATVSVDGREPVRIDMKSRCEGCSFTPVFALGGMSGGGASGLCRPKPRSREAVLLDDVRVFTRAFRPRETAQYAATFNAAYRPTVAVCAMWGGAQGETDVDNPQKWYCVNSIGEKIVALPSKETDVIAQGRTVPGIRRNSGFECRSFTVDGWLLADRANVDLRGVKRVRLTDNARIITRDGYAVAVDGLEAERVRLDGALGATGEMKIAGNLEMREGSILRIPSDMKKASIKSISIKGEGTVAIKTIQPLVRGRTQKILQIEELPKDLKRLRLHASSGPKEATFGGSALGKFLSVTPRE